MSAEARDGFYEFLRMLPVEDDVVASSADANFVGRMEGAEFEFHGAWDLWETLISDLTKVVTEENDELVIARIEDEGRLSLKKVVTVLAFAMEKHLDKKVSSAITSLLASRLYLLICGLKSAHIFGIYQKSLFERVIASYRAAYNAKLFNGEFTVSKPVKKKAAPKSRGNATAASFMDTSEHDSHDDAAGPDDVEVVTPTLLKELNQHLLYSLDQLYLYLTVIENIGQRNDQFRSLLDLIRLISRFDYSTQTRIYPVANLREFRALKLFSDRCFALAHEAMARRHNQEDLVLAKFCLPRLTFKGFDGQFARGNLNKQTNDAAQVMLKFVKEKFDGADEPDLHLLKRLAENVVHHCLAERIDYRMGAINIALELVKLLPEMFVMQFFYFATNYGYLPAQRCRLIAIDLVCSLMSNFDTKAYPIGVHFSEDADYEFARIFQAVEYDDDRFTRQNPSFKKDWKKFLFFKQPLEYNARDAMLRLLVASTMDKTSAVRGRALLGILPFVKTPEGYRELGRHAHYFLKDKRTQVIKILSEVNVHDENEAAAALARGNPISSQATTVNGASQNRPETPVPMDVHQAAQHEADFLTRVSAAPFVDLVMQRCNDKSAITRKFTVAVIEALLTVEQNPTYQKALLQCLQDFCRDPSVVVRKLGAEAMTNIVRDEEVFKQAWLHTVLPMVNDREESVEKSCRKMFFDKIVMPIIANDGSDSLSWNMMIEIAKTNEFVRAFRRCFLQTARDKDYNMVLRRLANVLYGAVKVDSVASSAWMLLDYLSDVIEVDPIPAVHAWFSSDESNPVDPAVRIVKKPTELVSILSILLKRHKSLSNADKIQLRDNIASRFVHLKLHETVISDAVIAFVGIFGGENVEDMNAFFKDVVRKFHNDLLTCPEDELELPVAEKKDKVAKRLLTLAQCCLHAPKGSVGKDLVKLLFAILSVDAPCLDEFIPTPAPGSQPSDFKVSGLSLAEISKDVSASAVIAIGKIFLANDTLADEYLIRLPEVLGSSLYASVRNNVIYVLGDCYLRHTIKMDPLQRTFLHGLRDKVKFVRYHCLLLTTELLRTQYMKMSPLVLARLLPLLLDPDEDIRNALTGETLAVIEDQFPNLYVDNFVTVMFLLNRVGFGAYQDVESLEMPPNPLTSLDHDFSGSLRLPKRIKLYKFMLEKFDDQKRFMLINQMSRTIFGNLVEGKVNFDTPEAKQLLLDALQVIQLPEARLTLTEGERPDDDEGEIATEELQKLARATIKATFCAAFVHHIMPQFMAMARFLATKMSPLQKEFRNCLASIAENYPDQLHVLFQDNVQLKTEIESELRRRKRENRKSRMIKNKRLVEQVAKTAPPSSQQMDTQAEGDKENDAPMDDAAAVPGRRSASVKTEPEVAAEAVVEQSARLSLEDAPMPEADGQEEPAGNVEAPPVNDESAPSAGTVRVKTEVVDETRGEAEAAPEEAMEVDEAAKAEPEPEPAQPSTPQREPSAQPATPEASIAPETPQIPSSSKTPTTTQPSSSPVPETPSSPTAETRQTPQRRASSPMSILPETPKQPSPKRRRSEQLRLSFNRIHALRAEGNSPALFRSPVLDAPVPKLSSRVGIRSDAPPRIPLPNVRVHSTPISSANDNLNFTFALPDMSPIREGETHHIETPKPSYRPGSKRPK
uniref:Cnd1 domain-containing protein n=1 Tax=Panagrellus redivivus TaxID=6233 RepID=A0A7E5A0G1_PANRE